MFWLIAEATQGKITGMIASREFDSIATAEDLMRRWARFGVDGLCDEADAIYICDAEGQPIRLWSRRLKMSMPISQNAALEAAAE
jgi:hypothetical protein